MKTFGRVLTAMVTPFNADYSVNYKAAADLAKHLAANGSDGLVLAGTTGESVTMTHDEKLKLFSTVLDAVGDKVSVIAGTGSNDTRASIEFTKEAEKIGVHGAMLVGPYYNKPPQEGFYQHFKAIAENTALPIIIYNVPGRTSSNILPPTVARLAQIKNIVAIKEASGNLDQVTDIINSTPDDFMVYSGDDDLTLPILALGGVGIISVASHIVGKQMKDMVDAYFAGDTDKAAKLHRFLHPFFKVIFITTNPIPIKTAVNIAGLNAGPLRLPMVPLGDAETEQLKKVMQQLGLI